MNPFALLGGFQAYRKEEVETEIATLRAQVEEARREADEWRTQRDVAEHQKAAALSDAARLREALRNVRHATDDDGDCWCMYLRLVHTPPDDAIPLRDGHTEECWQARAALAGEGEGT